MRFGSYLASLATAVLCRPPAPQVDPAARVFNARTDTGMIDWTVPAKVQHVDTIGHKPIPRWPGRRSYRSVARDARTRRNVAKRTASRR